MRTPESVSIDILLDRYDTLLLDAYGVLVDQQGALPGATTLIARLNREHRPYLILTNSASRLPEAMAEGFADMGLAIPAKRILSSGMLLIDHFAEKELQGARCLVLGPEAAETYVKRAGGVIVSLESEEDAEVVIIADQKGFALQAGMDRALNLILRRLDQEKAVELILCNPDLIYPVAPQQYGLTSGALAAMLEAVLQERYPEQPIQFERLGKPHSPIFAAAARKTGGKMVMLGDQLSTDILGAQHFGIPAALVMSGLARELSDSAVTIPDYVVESLEP